jgi:iron complex outermembrane receptor protein
LKLAPKHKALRAPIAVLLALGAAGAAGAQDGAVDEIVVVARGGPNRALQPSLTLNSDDIGQRAPIVAADILRSIPFVGVRTNSRGETVVRIRGAEERQVQVFLDGAPLSVPWDGRVDLGALPAGLIERARITSSAAPIEYGPNAVLGVIDFASLSPDQSGLRLAQAEAGSLGAANASLAGGIRSGAWRAVGAASYLRRDGLAESDSGAVPFAPRDGDLRSNTDLESATVFASGSYLPAWGGVRLSVLSAISARGAAPEGHLDPAFDPPRYWRYPDWRFTQATLNADFSLSPDWSFRGVAWLQDFSQTIDQYTDASYSTLDAREFDADETLGARLIADLERDAFGARLVINAQRSTHRQIDTNFASGTASPEAVFRQDLASLGAEFDASLSDTVKFSISGSFDHASSPLTGGREQQDDLTDWAGAAALRWRPNDDWSFAATLGRRTRFPTLRELYGEALSDFILNPDLNPETAVLADFTSTWTPANIPVEAELTAFASRIEDTLGRRTLRIAGKRFRQRYNQAGADARGVEARFAWDAADNLQIEGAVASQNLTSLQEADGSRSALFQRPELQANLAIDVQPTSRWDLRIELDHVGEARDEDASGAVVDLPASTQLNLRAFYALSADQSEAQRLLFVSIDNITDELVVPQIGLPAPGRTIRLGLRLAR